LTRQRFTRDRCANKGRFLNHHGRHHHHPPATEAPCPPARALNHLERAFESFRAQKPQSVERAVRAIVSAIDDLAAHPLIGGRIDGEIREFVISYGQTECLALYRFVVPRDAVRVLTIRRQRELGYLP